VNVVASSLTDSLDKPANDLRKTQLFETASPSVQQLTITHKDGSQLVLEKQPGGWQMLKPTQMSADQSAVEDLISTVVNMTPVEFVDEPSLIMGLSKPTATATFPAAPSHLTRARRRVPRRRPQRTTRCVHGRSRWTSLPFAVYGVHDMARFKAVPPRVQLSAWPRSSTCSRARRAHSRSLRTSAHAGRPFSLADR
jgi:hypothetical protein